MLNLTISKLAHLCNFLTAFAALVWLPTETQSHRQLPLKPSGQIQPSLTRDMEVSELRCSCKFRESEQLDTGPKRSTLHPALTALRSCLPSPGQGLRWIWEKFTSLNQACPLFQITAPKVNSPGMLGEVTSMIWRHKLTFHPNSRFCLSRLEAEGLLHWKKTILFQ